MGREAARRSVRIGVGGGASGSAPVTTACAGTKRLAQMVRIFADDNELSLASLEGVAVLNLQSYTGGIDLWGRVCDLSSASLARSRSIPASTHRASVAARARRASRRRSTTGDWNLCVACDADARDASASARRRAGRLRRLGAHGADSGPPEQRATPLSGVARAHRVQDAASGRNAGRRLVCERSPESNPPLVERRAWRQVDGEPWLQQPATIEITHHNVVPIVQRRGFGARLCVWLLPVWLARKFTFSSL